MFDSRSQCALPAAARALPAMLLCVSALNAQPAKPTPGTAAILTTLDASTVRYADVAKQIWNLAEVGYMEEKSSALLQAELKTAGFTVKAGVAGEPTAFIAEYGSGKPVIAILGEFDALPGLSQDATPERKVLKIGGPGHGCGHHLFGTASTAAAISLKQWMITNNVNGTLRMIGTPAEEGGAGKVYMVRDGVFRDVDAVIAWHPGDENAVDGGRSMANISGKFRFHGLSAHAAAAPERGKSALDAVEIMDVMTNFLREHIPDGSRIHYVITNGGKAPNVVPDEAEVYYVVRHVEMTIVKDIWNKVINAAKGAALGTGTTYDLQLVGSVYSLLPNETLAKVQQRALERVGGYTMTPDERMFAETLQKSEAFVAVPLETTAKVKPLAIGNMGAGSTDVGDVSWVVPTVQLNAATWVPGTAAHSWQAVAAGGMSIGFKGMMIAAKAELNAKRGARFTYETVLGDQKPQLDYRKGSVP